MAMRVAGSQPQNSWEIYGEAQLDHRSGAGLCCIKFAQLLGMSEAWEFRCKRAA